MWDRLTRALLSWARSPGGLWGIFVASFLETIIVPIPFEAILIPMMLADRSRIWLFATVAFLGCLAGAIAAYVVGLFFFESLGLPLIQMLGFTESFTAFQADLQESGFWIIVAVGITPVPFQVATVGSGFVGYPFILFLVAITLARAIRYYGLALLVRLFGQRVQKWIERHARTARRAGVVIVLLFVAYLVATQLTGSTPQ